MFMDHLGEQDGSGTPISSHTTKGSGPGGGSTKDLSAPKEKKAGTPVGSTGGNSGPGGGSGDKFGQKPSEDGGSNLLPAYDRGSSLGASDTPFANVTKDKVNPRGGKALASESAARRQARKRLNENIVLGISAIPSTVRNIHADEYILSEDDPDYDIKLAKKRAGLPNWWKV